MSKYAGLAERLRTAGQGAAFCFWGSGFPHLTVGLARSEAGGSWQVTFQRTDSLFLLVEKKVFRGIAIDCSEGFDLAYRAFCLLFLLS